ncbi:MAG: hypothetical protein ACFBSD_02585 [Paracoccaceae bacterium]
MDPIFLTELQQFADLRFAELLLALFAPAAVVMVLIGAVALVCAGDPRGDGPV